MPQTCLLQSITLPSPGSDPHRSFLAYSCGLPIHLPAIEHSKLMLQGWAWSYHALDHLMQIISICKTKSELLILTPQHSDSHIPKFSLVPYVNYLPVQLTRTMSYLYDFPQAMPGMKLNSSIKSTRETSIFWELWFLWTPKAFTVDASL